jgi:hypothetical protein
VLCGSDTIAESVEPWRLATGRAEPDWRGDHRQCVARVVPMVDVRVPVGIPTFFFTDSFFKHAIYVSRQQASWGIGDAPWRNGTRAARRAPARPREIARRETESWRERLASVSLSVYIYFADILLFIRLYIYITKI